MTTNTGLALRVPTVEDARSDFFREAYAAVCTTTPLRADPDRRVLQGVVLHLAEKYELDLSSTDGQAQTMDMLGAFLSLALEETAEGAPDAAVEILGDASLADLAAIGIALHEELRASALTTCKKSVVEFATGLYGILEPSDEFELRRLARPETVFAERSAFKEAKAFVKRAQQMLVLADHLPMQPAFEACLIFVQFQVVACRRKDAKTPSAGGGLFFLFLRSALFAALTWSKMGFPYPKFFHSQPIEDFLRYNLVCDAESISELVGDIFFEPEGVLRAVPLAAAKVREIFEGQIFLRPMSGPAYVREPLAFQRFQETFLSVVRRIFEEFAVSARQYFLSKEEARVSPDDLTAFWHPRLFLYVFKAWTGQGDRFFLRSAEDLAQSITSPDALLRTSPDQIVEYAPAVVAWPEEKRRRVLDGYPWNKLFDTLSNEKLFAKLPVLVQAFGPGFLGKLSHKRLVLTFWFLLWNEQPGVRDALLAWFQEGHYARRLTTHKLLVALDEAQGVREDERLFAYLLAETMRDTPGEYIYKVPTQVLGDGLRQLLNCPPALRVLYAKIDPAKREACLDHFTEHDRYRLSRGLGNSG